MTATATGAAARRVALDALERIERDDAYANLALGAALDRSGLSDVDRRLVTELVYGTIRRRRSCDHLVDRFLANAPPPAARAALRMGAYQLAFTEVPPYAAVGATVEATPKRFRGLVNAVLRRVSGGLDSVVWPDEATRLSYPDWIVERLVADLGEADALAACEAMNVAPTVTVRDDGYTQDEASQWVAGSVGAGPGDVVADVCAAPGGKATALATAGARVVAMDLRSARAGLVAANVARLDLGGRVAVVVGDATDPPLRPGAFDRVLVDAPCSGLGVLRRRPDARWRVTADAVDRLVEVQRGVLAAAVGLLRPGGTLVYGVCTVTRAETIDQATWVGERFGELTPLDRPDGPWRPWGDGGLLLPQDRGTDGMAVFRWQVAG